MKRILFFIPFILYSHNLMHPEDPKERDHNSLGFGVSGDLVVSDGVYYLGQTGSSLNNGSIYIYKRNVLWVNGSGNFNRSHRGRTGI